MRPTPFRVSAGRPAGRAFLFFIALLIPSFAAEKETAKPARGAALAGGTLPGGAVISAAVSSVSSMAGAGGGAAAASYAATGRIALSPEGGGKVVETAIAEDGSFSFKGLKPGAYRLRISMNAALSKQTQGATFGEKVNSGMASAGSAKTKHDTAKNSIGNIRAREENASGGVSVAAGDITGDGSAKIDHNLMPNRISMNVTVARQNLVASDDGESLQVIVGEDGSLTGRTHVVQPQAAEPATSGRSGPETAAPSGPPPRPAGG